MSQEMGQDEHASLNKDPSPDNCNAENFTQQENVDFKIIQLENMLFKCNIFQKQFRRRKELKSHTRLHTGPFECEICHQKFIQRCHIKRHKLVHTGEKPFECETCLQIFKRSGHLTIHTRIHTGEKPFECEICQKKFKQTSEFKSQL